MRQFLRNYRKTLSLQCYERSQETHLINQRRREIALIALEQINHKSASSDASAFRALFAISLDNLLRRRPEPEGGCRGAQLLQTSRVQENVVVVRLKENRVVRSLYGRLNWSGRSRQMKDKQIQFLQQIIGDEVL